MIECNPNPEQSEVMCKLFLLVEMSVQVGLNQNLILFLLYNQTWHFPMVQIVVRGVYKGSNFSAGHKRPTCCVNPFTEPVQDVKLAVLEEIMTENSEILQELNH